MALLELKPLPNPQGVDSESIRKNQGTAWENFKRIASGLLDLVLSSLSVTGRVNIGGAVDTSGWSLNVKSGHISTDGGRSLVAFGVGSPTNYAVGPTEYISLSHSGTLGEMYVTKTGSGTFRDLVIYTSDTERLRITAAGVVTISGDVQFGTAGKGVVYQAGPKDLAGSGTPEGAVTAPIGSTYRRSNGGAGTSFYVKESGAGNTGWVGK